MREIAPIRDGGPRASNRRPWPVLRLWTSLYLALFLLGSSVAPHRHANPAEDLLDGRPSDSGVLVAGAPQAPASGDCLFSLRLVDDDPCPACFSNDFAASSGPAATGLAVPASRSGRPGPGHARRAEIAAHLAVSRAPPPRGA